MQTDRQDKCALGWDHQEKLQLHESQKGTSSSPTPQLSSRAFGKLVFIPWLVTCLTSAVFLSEFRFHGVNLSMSPPIPEVPIVDRDKVIPSPPYTSATATGSLVPVASVGAFCPLGSWVHLFKVGYGLWRAHFFLWCWG